MSTTKKTFDSARGRQESGSVRASHPIVACVLFAFVGAGCPGDLENPERFGNGMTDRDGGMTMMECATAIFQDEAKCGGSICHDSADPAAGLDLTASGLGTALLDRPAAASADHSDAACEGQGNLIDSANPMDSLLYTKIASDTLPCGSQMPIGPALSAEEVECIRAWVLDQAN